MKKIYFLLMAFMLAVSGYAQINAYTFAGSAGTYTPITGTSITLSDQDDASTGNLPIGFNFNFNGTNETVFAASSNGLIILGQTTNGTGLSSNGIATSSKVIAGFWDDNNMTGGSIQYLTTGTAPNQILTVQYTGMHVGSSGSSSAATLNMQILLYESTNQIQIIYGATSAALTGKSASIGIASGTTNFISVTPTSTSAPFATVSTTTANDGVAVSTNIPTGTTYSFSAPSCSAPGGLVNNFTTTSATHSWNAASPTPSGYEWAVTTSGTPPASGTSTTGLTASSPVLTPSTTYYLHVRSNCGGGTFSSWSTTSFYTGYCLASSTNSTPSWISNFTTTGGVSNITHTAASAAAGGYVDLTSTVVSNYLGNSTSFSITSGGPTVGNAIWIDWNNNLVFETTERMFVTSGYITSTSGSFSIPASTPNGNYRMRVITDYNNSAPSNPCGNITQGEYKDFTFSVVNAPSCLPPTTLVNSSVTIASASHTWAAPSPAPAVGYEWAVTTSNTPPASGTATTGLTVNSSGLSANTTYYLHVRSDCGGGTYSSWSTSAGFYTGYCIFSGSSSSSYFDAFSTTGGTTNISNSGSGYSTGGYGDFTAQKVTQIQGGTVNFAGTLVVADEGVAMWVDYNDNLTFETTERVYNSAGYISTLAGSFSIAPTAPLGNHRMRIVMDYNATNPSPCSLGFGRGEAEDYILEVLAAPACAGPISGGTASATVTTSCGSSAATLNVTGASTGTGLTYQWQSSPTGAGTFTDISGATTVPYTTASITASTDFQLVVTCANGPAIGTSTVYTLNVSSTVPNCTNNIAPANLATNVSTIPNINLSWNAAATATNYDVYIGTVNPPTTLLGNYTATNVNVFGFSGSTTYYWYVIPKNICGSATGCSTTNVTSFTTSVVCNPSTSNGGTSSDALTDFTLVGEASSISVLGATPIASPGYIDLTATSTVTLAAGKAYAGAFSTQDANDLLTIWIDFNNNGGFEASEKVLNNLKPLGSSTSTPYSIFIPATSAVGTYKMRVRNVYNASATPLSVDACANYTYGESKDFTVVIGAVGSGAAYTLSPIGSGACAAAASTTIDAPSNNTSMLVPILDATGNLIAEVNANGNNLGKITASQYINTGAVRTTTNAASVVQQYLDRNITITPATQPTSNVSVNLYMTDAELAALMVADPLITGIADIACTKNSQACSGAITNAPGSFHAQTGNGTLGTNKYYTVSIPGFSTFFTSRGATGILPIAIEYLNGTKHGNENVIDWKVSCTSTPSVFIELTRSNDSRNFKTIHAEIATDTRCQQAFEYTDANPASGINYYRLKTTAPDGAVKYSNIIALVNKDKGFELISVAPNPVRDNAILTLTSAKAGKIEIVITDIVGKVVAKQSNTVIAGNNPINMNFAHLAAGTYNITAVNADGEVKVTRFVKY